MTKERTEPVPVALPSWGVYALESQHSPSFRMSLSTHDFLEIFLVFSGTGTFQLEDQQITCEAHDVLIVPPGCQHTIHDNPAQPLWLFGVCVSPVVWKHESHFLVDLGMGKRSLTLEISARFRADLRRILYEQTHPGPGSQLRISGIAQQLLAELIRIPVEHAQHGTTSQTSNLKQIVTNYAQQLELTFFEPATIDQVANQLGMSRRRFTSLFREVTGNSWAHHVTGLRMNYARKLILETNRTIESIAFETGYEELSGFYRAFRRELGISPRQYRDQTDPPLHQNHARQQVD
jgi:AraC family L-rhamnose operon regulatory protein RhaS